MFEKIPHDILQIILEYNGTIKYRKWQIYKSNI